MLVDLKFVLKVGGLDLSACVSALVQSHMLAPMPLPTPLLTAQHTHTPHALNTPHPTPHPPQFALVLMERGDARGPAHAMAALQREDYAGGGGGGSMMGGGGGMMGGSAGPARSGGGI